MTIGKGIAIAGCALALAAIAFSPASDALVVLALMAPILAVVWVL
jgi:hypothetical protein